MAAPSPLALRRRREAGEDITGITASTRMGKTNTNILTGADDLSEWSDEELRMGQRKDHRGKWGGAKPKVIPRALYNELMRRQLGEAQQKLNDALGDAVDMLVSIVNGADVDARDRLKAIGMIMDRSMGKEAVKVEITEKKRWEVALERSIVSAIHVTTDKFAEDMQEHTATWTNGEVIEASLADDDQDPFD
jgi:hypothetical protein